MRPTENTLAGDVATLLFCPAVMLHELSHWLAYTALGYESDLNLHCFSFDRTRSHVRTARTPTGRAQLVATAAPFVLLVPGILSQQVIRRVADLPLVLYYALVLTGVGLVAYARPSKSDWDGLFACARYFDGFRISLLERTVLVSNVWLISIWLGVTFGWTDGAFLRYAVSTFGLLFIGFCGIVVYDMLTRRWRERQKRIHHLVASLLFDEGRYEEAEHHCRTAVELDDDDPELQATLSAILLEQGRTAEAEDRCQTALDLAPEHPVVWANYAAVLIEADQTAEAEEYSQRALELDDSLSITHANYAEVLLEQSNLQDAKKHCEKALERTPDHPEVHTIYGDVLVALDRPQEAKQQYQAALELNAEYQNARESYADLLDSLDRDDDVQQVGTARNPTT